MSFYALTCCLHINLFILVYSLGFSCLSPNCIFRKQSVLCYIVCCKSMKESSLSGSELQ